MIIDQTRGGGGMGCHDHVETGADCYLPDCSARPIPSPPPSSPFCSPTTTHTTTHLHDWSVLPRTLSNIRMSLMCGYRG